MTTENLIAATEDELRDLAATLTDIRDRECLLCYVYRMLEFGCRGLRWAGRYRDIRAPRATGLERRLSRMGGFCDCEIFMNAFMPIPEVWQRPAAGSGADIDAGADAGDDQPDPEWPARMPPCRGAARGSTKPCSLWARGRPGW